MLRATLLFSFGPNWNFVLGIEKGVAKVREMQKAGKIKNGQRRLVKSIICRKSISKRYVSHSEE